MHPRGQRSRLARHVRRIAGQPGFIRTRWPHRRAAVQASSRGRPQTSSCSAFPHSLWSTWLGACRARLHCAGHQTVAQGSRVRHRAPVVPGPQRAACFARLERATHPLVALTALLPDPCRMHSFCVPRMAHVVCAWGWIARRRTIRLTPPPALRGLGCRCDQRDFLRELRGSHRAGQRTGTPARAPLKSPRFL